MVIKDFYKSRYKTKWFFLSLILTVILLILVNYIVLPFYFGGELNIIDSVNSLLNNLIALVISVLIASIAFLLFSPKIIRNSDIEIIHPKDLKNELEKITNGTDVYYYMGHTARWNRSVNLEKLKKEAEEKKTRVEIDFLILNPNNIKLCNYYASFGHSNRKNGVNVQNAKDVKIEIITTILLCAKYNLNPFLRVSIYFLDKASLFRLDISDKGIIFTKPYPEQPALLFPKDTFFYKSYKEEFKISREQCEKIGLKNLPAEINLESCKYYLREIGIDFEDIDDDDIEKIIRKMDNLDRPY